MALLITSRCVNYWLRLTTGNRVFFKRVKDKILIFTLVYCLCDNNLKFLLFINLSWKLIEEPKKFTEIVNFRHLGVNEKLYRRG